MSEGKHLRWSCCWGLGSAWGTQRSAPSPLGEKSCPRACQQSCLLLGLGAVLRDPSNPSVTVRHLA